MTDEIRSLIFEELKRQQLGYADAIIRVIEALKKQPGFDVRAFESEIKRLKTGMTEQDSVGLLILEVAGGERRGPA